MKSMDDKELYSLIEQFVDAEIERQKGQERKYPSDVPNEVARYGFIRGYLIENSFEPTVGDYTHLCKIGLEDLCVWTYKKDSYSVLVSETELSVKAQPYWKTAAHLIWLSRMFYNAFESASYDDLPDYKWMYYFVPGETKIDEVVFYGLSELEAKFLATGTVIKMTDVATYAQVIDLLLRDDKAYTALSMIFSAFCTHPCCLTCELSQTPWHDHLAYEPSLWKQVEMLPKLECAIVQSCRAVEAIIGEPPNQNKQGKVYAHKSHWLKTIGVNPDDIFGKVQMSYLDYYYKLFFDLRNPSAHSYGNVHYDLLRKQAVEAQRFAAIIVREYIRTNILDEEQAIDSLNFNRDLLARVSENMSTKITK